jgi:hypothetical protein
MQDVDIAKIRHECQRILAYTEGLGGNCVQRDTALGDALFLRIQNLHELAHAALMPAPIEGEGGQCADPGQSSVRPFTPAKGR